MKKIQILGTGCPKCNKLADVAQKVAADSGVPFELTKVTDINEILGFGVMMTPALVIDGDVKAVGKIPTPAEITNWLK
jgi:small redox-active disulfide protein 2